MRKKPLPAYDHGSIQIQFGRLIPPPDYVVSAELTVRIGEGKYLVPDVGVQLRSKVQKPYLAKCDEYLAWRVPQEIPASGSLEAGEISVSLSELFSVLD